MADKAIYDSLLRFKVYKGLQEYGLSHDPKYIERVEYELGVISQTGFSGYFLIVSDLCRFMRQAKPRPVRFLVRGSGCGSICVWLLKISHRWLDPIVLELPFERFLNPARVSNPDLDIDIQDDRRSEVVEYTIQKYGKDRVAKIATFGTLGAKASIIDIARAQQLPDYQQVAAGISGLISAKPGTELAKELAKTPALREKQQAYPQLFDIALRVEGKARHASIHAAGTIIAPDNLWKFVPTYWKHQPDDRDEEAWFPCTQWDMYDVEKAGLLKMDYLGLKTLKVVDQSEYLINRIREVRGEPPFDINTIDRHDPRTWDLLARGDLSGVFQLEKQFVRNFARRMKLAARKEPWDLAVLVSIIRPGMMDCGATEKFLRRANGEEEPTPIIPKLGELGVLKRKYELFVFQEDCMLVAVKLAGFTMSEADELRRAIGKKQAEKIAEIKPKFIAGCVKTHGVTEAEAETVWSNMETFVRYGFNNAHAAAYGCVLAYQTAYLKTHFPLIYMNCLINSEAGSTSKDGGYNYKVAEYVEEARAMGIKVLPPCLKKSASSCRANVDTSEIIFGLSLIKGTSNAGVDWVLRHCRQTNSLAEFVMASYEVVNTGLKRTHKVKGQDVATKDDQWRCYTRVNKATIQAMIWAGALDVFMGGEAADRPRMIAMLEGLSDLAEKYHAAVAKTRSGQHPKVEADAWKALVFAHQVDESAIERVTMEDLVERERAVTGCFLTWSPFEPFLYLYRQNNLASFEDIEDCDLDDLVVMVMVRSAREFICKNGRAKGKAMLRLSLDVAGGSLECPIFPDDLAALKAAKVEVEASKVYLARLRRNRTGTEYICAGLQRVSNKGYAVAA